jgi:aromatic-L-amino-acid decarboxylase
MKSDEFRKNGHAMINWMAEYMESVENFPVRSQVKPGDIASSLPIDPPVEGESMEIIFEDFKEKILPGITHWQHPSFFAYFPANSSPPSVLAEMLTSTLGAQCMLWQTSPAATEMETRLTDWLRRMTHLPSGLHGVIQDSASSATLCALLTARERATDWQSNKNGMTALSANLMVYTSEEAHSSTEKGAKIAGFGKDNVRLISTDENFSMCPKALKTAIINDLTDGHIPTCVVASMGTTGVGAVDPLKDVGDICKQYNLFFHVDAAWAGSALILPEENWMAEGIEMADSIVFNPHKWLLTNFDCSVHYVKNPDDLIRTLSILPEYLKSKDQEKIIDYRDWSVPLGRRFRALKLWFVIRSYGVKGLQEILRNHIKMACEAEKWIKESSDFELVAPRSLSLFNFRYCPAEITSQFEIDQLNERLLNQLNDTGEVYFTQNRVRGIYAIRWSIGQTNTLPIHIEKAWSTIQHVARGLI